MRADHEWVYKFRTELARLTNLEGHELTSVVDAELETYFDKDELWKEYTPEDAVSENLSSWTW